MPKKSNTSPKNYATSNSAEENNVVSEPVASRAHAGALAKVVILANATKKSESHLTSFEKMNIVREGISKKDLEQLKQKAGLDYDTLAKTLNVARATLINKKSNEKFNTVLSEKIVSIADIYSYGFEVFGDEANFRQWMSKPNKAIGGHIPGDIMDNQYGREEVKSLIGRIAYGVYS